jgi:hypothetical protein
VARQRGFGHDPSFPHRLQEIVSCHNLFAILDEEEQQIEYLRSNGDELRAALELAPVSVQAIIFEQDRHFRALLGQESKKNSIAIQCGCKAFRPACAHSCVAFRKKPLAVPKSKKATGSAQIESKKSHEDCRYWRSGLIGTKLSEVNNAARAPPCRLRGG